MTVEVYIYTRADKKKSALESYRPTEKFLVENGEVKKVFEKVEE